MRASAWTTIVLWCCLSSVIEAAPDKVQFPSLDRWRGDQPLMLDGYWYKSTGQNPAPAIAMFHGCSGALTKKGKISERFVNMAEHLNRAGYSVLLVDSFTPRGIREICTTHTKNREIAVSNRGLDAYGALAYLNTRPEVIPGKIGAIGFSHGAMTILNLINASSPPYRETAKGFVAAVAFYPGCRDVLGQKPAFQAYAPLLMLAGELDDWTKAEPCERLAKQSKKKGQSVDIVVYPGAYHGFDETASVHKRTDIPHATNSGVGVHVGGNPAAREDAYRRTREFFGKHLPVNS